MKTNKRISLWDNLKFILIFLVVVGHFIDFHTYHSTNMKRLFFYIYIFHMPLFIFISGLFSKKNINERKYRKIFEYLILYLALQIIFFTSNVITNGPFSITFFYEGGIPWFMLSLFFFNLLTIFLKRLNYKYLFTLSIILACFIGYDAQITDFLALSRTIVFYPFFLAGYYFDSNKVIEFCKRKKIKMLSVIFLLLSAIICYLFISKLYIFRPLITGRNPFNTLGHFYKYGCIIRLIYYLVATLFIISLISLTPSKNTPFTSLGARSLQVYILHFPCILIFYRILHGYKILEYMPSYLMIIPLALLLTIVLSQKQLEKPINFIKTIKFNEE